MILIKIIMLAKINYNSGLNLLFKSHDLSKTCPMKKGFAFGHRILDKCPKHPIVQLPNAGFMYYGVVSRKIQPQAQ
jgi:hypothetical protein